jgi:hypothetical protein
MSKSLAMFALLAGLAGPLVLPGTAFAQNCDPAQVGCPANYGGGGRVEHRDDRPLPDGNGPHMNNGTPASPGIHAAGGNVGAMGEAYVGSTAHGAGMGHGAGGAAGGATGGAAGGAAGGGHGK